MTLFASVLQDVRSNTTVATPCDPNDTQPGAGFYLNGHKWFTSAPMCDAFITLAQTANGISCFLVPRWVPHTGERNRGLRFLRLKANAEKKKKKKKEGGGGGGGGGRRRRRRRTRRTRIRRTRIRRIRERGGRGGGGGGLKKKKKKKGGRK